MQAFAEQAAALIESGVDLIWIETMADLEEVRAAVEGIRQVSQDIPVMTTMTFDTHGRTMMGVTPEKAVTTMTSFGASAVGGNCGNGPAEILGVIEKMHATATGGDPGCQVERRRPNPGWRASGVRCKPGRYG